MATIYQVWHWYSCLYELDTYGKDLISTHRTFDGAKERMEKEANEECESYSKLILNSKCRQDKVGVDSIDIYDDSIDAQDGQDKIIESYYILQAELLD